MFVQVFQGKVKDPEAMRACMQRWNEELRPGATGFLGSTCGLADDGTFIATARFESAEAARANSDRPEQGEWWKEAEHCFDGTPTFFNCNEVIEVLRGGSDDAGFVQIMEGTSPDVHRLHEIMSRHPDEMHQMRPEIIGGLMMDAGDGHYVDAFYFTSEADARQGEKKEMPAEFRDEMDEAMRLSGDVQYFDLHEPMLIGAR